MVQLDGVEVVMGIVGATVTAGLAVWTTLRSTGRPARLRREEGLWRQVLEVTQGQEAQVIRELHRHTTAELVARQVGRAPTPGFRVFVALGSTLAVLAGLLGAEVAVNLQSADVNLQSPDVLNAIRWCIFLVVAAGGLLAVSLKEVVAVAEERNRLARQVLGVDDVSPAVSGWVHRWFIAALVLSWGMVGASLAAALWTLGRLVTSGVSAFYAVVVIFLSMFLYVVGLYTASDAWYRLARRRPQVGSETLDQLVIAASDQQSPPGGPVPDAPRLGRVRGLLVGAMVGLWAAGRRQ